MGCSSSTEIPPSTITENPSAQVQNHPTTTVNTTAEVQNHPASDPDDVQQEIKTVNLDKSTLERYVHLEQQIHLYETKNVQKALEDLSDDDEKLTLNCKEYQEQLRIAHENVAREKSDVDNLNEPTVQAYLKSRGQFEEQFSKEEEEYIEALNKLEMIKKQIMNTENLKEKNKPVLEKLKAENEELNKLYQEEDSLLASIFNGSYGSELEDQLEQQLDKDMDRKQRVGVAKFKWNNAKVLLQYAVTQLGQACKKWKQTLSIVQTNPTLLMVVVTEARNNIIAALQNITEAQKYLSNIAFPYCKSDEINLVNQAIRNIYTDVHHIERHNMACNLYQTLHNRAVALVQWFDLVIDKTINIDYQHIVKVVRDKERLLRAERLRLIKEKIKQASGEDAECDSELGFEDEEEPELEGLDHHTDVDAVQGSEQNSSSLMPADDRNNDVCTPRPSPPLELAPAPANMISNIEELKKQHEQDMEEYRRQQELNKTRTNVELQEKLKQRRSRRKRQEIN